jgi:hypothetical protein
MNDTALPAPQPPSDPPYGVRVSIWGIEFTIPLSKPSLYFLAVVVLLGAALVGLSKYYVLLQKTEWTNTLNDALAYAQLLPTTELAEFMKHFTETPQVTFPGPAGVQLAYYASDGCILVSRLVPGRPVTKHWILDLSRVPLPTPPQPTSGALPATHSNQSSVSVEGTLVAELALPPALSSLPSGYRKASHAGYPGPHVAEPEDTGKLAQLENAPPMLMPAQAPGGHCLNPHPGQFQWSYGQVNGCLVQVWRTWPDGCTQNQWYNRCYNYFDPAINWTHCVH